MGLADLVLPLGLLAVIIAAAFRFKPMIESFLEMFTMEVQV